MQEGCFYNYYQPMTRITPTPKNNSTNNQMNNQMNNSMNNQMNNSDYETAPGSPTSLGVEYTQGYLKTQIGKRMRVTFLIGTNIIQDRNGILEEVGISYITLREEETTNLVLCDIYAIKFVNIFK